MAHINEDKNLPATLDAHIDSANLPGHIAIVMDGNGRWATQRNLPVVSGHEAGAESVRRVIEAARQLGISALSLYAFSTENWSRDLDEVNALFSLMSRFVHQEIDEIDQNDIRVRIMGRMEELPDQARKDLEYCIERTSGNKSLNLNVAINYGSRIELTDAMRKLAHLLESGELSPGAIDETAITSQLYIPEFSEVDLLIRTSGEQRLSNFMLWQVSYAEFYFCNTLWPDFSKQDFCDAIVEYQRRHRRFGGDHAHNITRK